MCVCVFVWAYVICVETNMCACIYVQTYAHITCRCPLQNNAHSIMGSATM